MKGEEGEGEKRVSCCVPSVELPVYFEYELTQHGCPTRQGTVYNPHLPPMGQLSVVEQIAMLQRATSAELVGTWFWKMAQSREGWRKKWKGDSADERSPLRR